MTRVSLTGSSSVFVGTLSGDVSGPQNATVISVGAVTDTKASLAFKPSMTVVATSNITLSGLQTIDGQALTAISTVLAAGQTIGSQNGPWQVSAGAWTRPTWYPSGGTTQAFQFITTLIRLGTTYQGTVWRMTTSGPVTIDTTATTWAVTPIALNASTVAGATISGVAISGSSLTLPTFTQGSVLFAGPGGLISQDNANFFWNDTNDSLGLGTNTPGSNTIIDAININGAAKSLRITGYGTGSSVGLKGQFARGTLGTPAPAQSGDLLNFFSGTGYGTSFPASTGVINVVAGETFSGTSNATYLQFMTTPTGSVSKVERMRINSTGNVLIDTTTDNGVDTLQIGSGIASNYLKLTGSTSGYAELTVPATVTSYIWSLPATQGAASSYLQNDGSGNLSWSAGTPPAVTSNIDGGTSSTLYTSPQIILGGSP